MTVNITIIGTGYVGLVSGACFAKIGHNVTCVDNDAEKIQNLQLGKIPIYEPDLVEIIQNCPIKFTTDLDLDNAEAVFLAVGTPTDEQTKNANMTAFFNAARQVESKINNKITVITKSTVPLGTAEKLTDIFKDKAYVVSNPEFLREGSAVSDFMKPDRIVIGSNSKQAITLMQKIYAPLNAKMQITSLQSAELIKYASNTFLAAKVVFINEMADLCEATGASIEEVATGMGLDKRIGAEFLKPGPGIGGSCFPKDARALAVQAANIGKPSKIIEALIESNEQRKANIAKRIIKKVNHGKIAIFGVTFKANTDDVRESPAISIIKYLKDAKMLISAYDPKGHVEGINMSKTPYEAAKDADCIVILTEWDEFKTLNYQKLEVKKKVIMDFRNVLKSSPPKEFEYICI